MLETAVKRQSKNGVTVLCWLEIGSISKRLPIIITAANPKIIVRDDEKNFLKELILSPYLSYFFIQVRGERNISNGNISSLPSNIDKESTIFEKSV